MVQSALRSVANLESPVDMPVNSNGTFPSRLTLIQAIHPLHATNPIPVKPA